MEIASSVVESPIGDIELLHNGVPVRAGRPPVLLVHGGCHGAWCWERWLALLAERGWAAFAMSMRGHGGSGGDARGAGIADYADDVIAAGRSLPRPPVLVGHSMGGVVVERAATLMPVPGMALVAPGHGGPIGLVRHAAANPRSFAGLLRGRSIAFNHHDLFSGDVPAGEGAEMIGRLTRESVKAQLEILVPRRRDTAECPMLLIASPDDALLSVSVVRRTARRYGVQPLLFPGLGHNLMLEPQTAPVVDALTSWLDTLTA